MNFPPHPNSLTGAEAERARIWARQSKSGIVTLCGAKDEGGACYYPLTIVRNPAKSNDPTAVKTPDGTAFLGRCSYDPDGHGEQLIHPQKREDQI